MKKVNKIAFLVNWAREIDMYYNLISVMPSKKIQVIANDINSSEVIRNNNFKYISLGLKKKRIKFKKLSNIYNKKKYKILISTGETGVKTFNTSSILKFFYYHLVGKLFIFFKFDKILFKIFGRPLTCSSSKTFFVEKFIEKSISDISIKFPWTMELNYTGYPDKRWENNFKIFFTHGNVDSDLIKKKFKKKEIFKIGYPRYERLEKNNLKLKRKLKKIFKINNNKKIIFWIPTHIDTQKEVGLNLTLWMNYLSKIIARYNIIVRPHTKTLNYDPRLPNKLKEKGFYVDVDSDRKIGELFKISDLIIADYGGSVFSALYLLKPLLLLNLPNNSNYVLNKERIKTFDLKIRNFIKPINLNISQKNLDIKLVSLLKKNNVKKLKTIRKYFFGKENLNNRLVKTKKYLLNLLISKNEKKN